MTRSELTDLGCFHLPRMHIVCFSMAVLRSKRTHDRPTINSLPMNKETQIVEVVEIEFVSLEIAVAPAIKYFKKSSTFPKLGSSGGRESLKSQIRG